MWKETAWTVTPSFAHALDKLFRWCLLQEIAAGPRTHRLENALVIIVDGNHQHEHIWIAGFERLDAGDPGHAGQTDVEKRSRAFARETTECDRDVVNRTFASLDTSRSRTRAHMVARSLADSYSRA